MKNSKKNSRFKGQNVQHSFTGKQVTAYAGLSPLMRRINQVFRLGQTFNELFPTVMHNATKFTTAEAMMAVVLACFSGVKGLKNIGVFTHDALVLRLLGLQKGLNKDVIATRFKALGQAGAVKLHEYGLSFTKSWLKKYSPSSMTLDCDSTVKTVYGKQEGAAKGYNSEKKGARSYHPLLAFSSELKLVVNSWFRTGSAYTSNGICEFVKQVKASLPATIEHVFFRADSGFFNGALFDLLEELKWSYLVKVKLKGLKKLLESQTWTELQENTAVAFCEFEYQAKSWKKARKLRAIRSLKGYKKVDYFGQPAYIPLYDYACYCSDLPGTAIELHKKYKQRATSETWIEQVKSQLLAGSTLTDDFHANDILWQLSVQAYNLSVMLRQKAKAIWRQEHETFRNWFIHVPALVVRGGHKVTMKIYEHYLYKERWKNFGDVLLA